MTTASPRTPLRGEQGRHYAFIQQTIAPCLVQSSSVRRHALKHTPAKLPSWYAAATDVQKNRLKALLDARCESLNALEETLDKLQSVQTFCQPLLEAALKKAGYPLDVNLTWLRLYSPVKDGFGVTTGGFKVKTFSLLQAALNNFEAGESAAGFFNAASGFINEPDARGQFERHVTDLKIETFVKLCRELDLGTQYQGHLKRLLYPADALSEPVWRERYLRYQKDALLAAAYLALLKGDIDEEDHALLLRVVAAERRIMLGKKQVWYSTPCLMNLKLHDCLIIEPCEKYRYSDGFIAYIPDDPEHPIKRYGSFGEFQNALSQRLKGNPGGRSRAVETPVTDYQRFISGFIAYKDRPYYFRRLTELVTDAPPQPFAAQWLRSEWGKLVLDVAAPRLSPVNSLLGDPQPQVRVPVTDPSFAINADAIGGLWADIDLWQHRYDSLRTRLLADARAQAIPTADVDASARAARLQHYLNIGLFAVNLIAIVVPPLGAVMSVVMVGQVLYEVLDGVIELSEGDREAGWAHISDVVENLAQLAAGAAVFHFTVSPFIENLKAVQLPSGKTRLWNPDLASYEHTGPLPAHSTDERGLHRVGDHQFLTLAGKRYRVGQAPLSEGYCIEHPTRPDAYRPLLVENGNGAWNHELERPLNWQAATLMRRLGPMVDGLSDVQLEQIQKVSGVHEDQLRRMHVEGEPMPAVLLDTIRQFRAYDEAVQVSVGIGAGALSDTLCGYTASLAAELPGWPSGKAIEAFTEHSLTGTSVKYGDLQANSANTLAVSRTELMTGQLPRRIIEFLEESQIDVLVGAQTPRNLPSRAGALQKQLQARASYCRSRIMRSVYTSQAPQVNAAEALVQRDFKRLPTLMVREMLAEATPAEHSAIARGTRLPLRLAQKARQLQQQVRLNDAYEGLYLEAMASKDSEALALNSLVNLPGWRDSLRLEIREGGLEGELRSSFGAMDAAERKVLVRLAEGQYQAFDARGQQLHGVNGLYGALQHALTDSHRNAIGLSHVGQGEQLKALLLDKALPREQLRRILGMQPPRQPFFRSPWRLPGRRLGYPLSGRGQGTWRHIIEERVKALYRSMNRKQMEGYLRGRNLEDDTWLKALEAEYKQLDSVLSRWTMDGAANRAAYNVRQTFSRAVRMAWSRGGEWDLDAQGNYRGQRITLTRPAPGLGAELATLPRLPGNFEHVSSLYLPDCGLTDASVGVLSSFRRLRLLDLSGNELTLLPQALEHMPYLEGLDLADNALALTPQTAQHIKAMVHLESLNLSGNPLSTNVDVSRMPRLRFLHLSGCDLTEWPVGLFARPRPRGFYLELLGNHLTRIPEVAPGSERADILARSVVTREYLAPDVLDNLKLYIESVGLDSDWRFPPRGALDSAHWQHGLSMEQWASKLEVWDALEEAHGSERFFDELRKLNELSAQRTPAYLESLTAKVWRMLEAMEASSALRERLFEMAIAPTTCVDSGVQLFNAMGVEVLLDEALSLPNAGLQKLELLDLARSKARLDELGRIAHARVKQLFDEGRPFPRYDSENNPIQQVDSRGNRVAAIDEVEIYLAYTTRLADRLDLPWQSRMQFTEPDVTDVMIEDAYARVVALERGDLLRESILDQPFWVGYIQEHYAEEFKVVSAKNEALINLYTAQQELAEDGRLSAQEKADLRITIDTSARVLGKLPSPGTPERAMSDDEYFDEVASLGEEHKDVLRAVTDRVMGREPQNRK